MSIPITSSTLPAFLPVPRGPLTIPEDRVDRIDLSLILPTFNEAQNIQSLLAIVSSTLRDIDRLHFEIIVVDDNSPDGTARLALDESIALPEVRVMRRTEEAGLATAVIRGWQAARGDTLAVMDADLQHPPEALIQLVQAMRAGHDLAVGSRHVADGGVSDWSLFRRMISRTAQLIGLALLPEVVGRVSDPMSGYFMVKRSAIGGKVLNPTGYKILIEILARGRSRSIAEIGYVFRERQEGQSKVSASVYLQYLQHLLRLRVALLRNSRFVRFCIVGLTGVGVDMLLLFLLSDPTMLAWGLTRSKVIAAEAAIVNNFLWNDLWTFADLVGFKDSLRRKCRRFLKFNVICFMGLILSVIVLNILFNWLGMNRYAANAIAILASTLWNYQVNRHLGWRSSN